MLYYSSIRYVGYAFRDFRDYGYLLFPIITYISNSDQLSRLFGYDAEEKDTKASDEEKSESQV
jgi:hypothetical protein